MPPLVFEPAIPASEQPQTHASDRAATGTGGFDVKCVNNPILLCGDGFMDFIHRPKGKILKKLKSQRFGSWLCFHPQVNGVGEEKNLLCWGQRVGSSLFSVHLRREAEPASETL
jgi:hypothetical protein